MGVYIKGREMPNNCQECVCLNDEYFYCQAVGRQPQDENVVSRRPDWCPLVEVPTPHSDLIDQGVAVQIAMEWCPDDDGTVGKIGDLRELLDEIEAMPTIIEAEEES